MSTLQEKAENQKLLPPREEFADRPGYERKPAKVWRTGVGWVDGYKWRYRFKANNGSGKLTHEAREVQKLITPYAKAEEARRAKIAQAPEHVAPAQQADSTPRRPTFGVLVGRNRLDDYCHDCGMSPSWCECGEE